MEIYSPFGLKAVCTKQMREGREGGRERQLIVR